MLPTGTYAGVLRSARLRDASRGIGSTLYNHFIVAGYVYDWLLALVLVVINWTVPCILIKPLDRFYVPDDPALSYPSLRAPLTEDQKFVLIFGLPALVSAVAQLWLKSWLDWCEEPTAIEPHLLTVTGAPAAAEHATPWQITLAHIARLVRMSGTAPR
jgi:hypothetical protein